MERQLPILGWLPAMTRDGSQSTPSRRSRFGPCSSPRPRLRDLGRGSRPVRPLHGLRRADRLRIFGTSRHVIQGPSGSVAAVSLAVITPFVGTSAIDTSKAVPMTAALAIMTGMIYLVLRIARIGDLQLPVTSGHERLHSRLRSASSSTSPTSSSASTSRRGATGTNSWARSSRSPIPTWPPWPSVRPRSSPCCSCGISFPGGHGHSSPSSSRSLP